MSVMMLSMMRHQTKTFLDNGQFIVPPNVYCLLVSMCGGGGGACDTLGSGGGGGYVEDYPLAVTPGETLSIVVGAAGANLASGVVGAGTSGGSSYITRPTDPGNQILAVGGGGGARRTSTSITNSYRYGGDGGTPNGSGGGAGPVTDGHSISGGTGLGSGNGSGYSVGIAGIAGPAPGIYGAKSPTGPGMTPMAYGNGGYMNPSSGSESNVAPRPGKVELKWYGNDPESFGLSYHLPVGLPMRVLTLTSNITFTMPKEIEVFWLYGTAGGGGNCADRAGGGAGGYCWALPMGVQYNDIIDIIVPTGGVGSSAIATAGTAGGDLVISKNAVEVLRFYGGNGGVGAGQVASGGDGGYPNGSGGGTAVPSTVKASGGCGTRRTNTQLSVGGGHQDGTSANQLLFGVGPLANCGKFGGASPFPKYGAGGKATAANGEPGVLHIVYYAAEAIAI